MEKRLKIQLLSNQVITKMNKSQKPMQVLEVAYKNLTFNGKVEAKQLFDFGAQKDAFQVLVTGTVATIYDVEVVKNNAGYNDWIKVTKGEASNDTSTSVGKTTAHQSSHHGTTSS